jgi:hypothetical protein
MSRPASDSRAAVLTVDLLRERLPGPRSTTVARHLDRAEHMGREIWKRFQVGPYQWQVKHVRWFLEVRTREFSPSTRYRYWLTARAAITALGRSREWEPRLRGPWLRPTGSSQPLQQGRPPKLPRSVRWASADRATTDLSLQYDQTRLSVLSRE